MYKIVGADQKEYGPVSLEQLRQWILGGRANAQTRAQPVGGAGWQPLSEFLEFADVLATRAAAAPPKPAGPPPTSGMAIASLVLGLVGVCGITAVLGLIFGIVSLGKIKRSQGRLGGQGFAIAGLALSGIMLLFSIPFLAGMTLPALAKARQRAQTIACMNNAKQLALATIMYAADNQDRLPEATRWCDLIQPNVLAAGTATASVFKCPASPEASRCDYAFNRLLSGRKTSELGDQAHTVLFVEAEGGWNASGGPELLESRHRHRDAIAVGFADGHVEMLKDRRLDNLRWVP